MPVRPHRVTTLWQAFADPATGLVTAGTGLDFMGSQYTFRCDVSRLCCFTIHFNDKHVLAVATPSSGPPPHCSLSPPNAQPRPPSLFPFPSLLRHTITFFSKIPPYHLLLPLPHIPLCRRFPPLRLHSHALFLLIGENKGKSHVTLHTSRSSNVTHHVVAAW